MTLLLRDPDAKAAEPDAETPPEATPEVRACPRCSAPLEPEQDWCLQCGEAQPGRLSSLPGKRAAATVLALTTLMVGGAVAASYAALNEDGPAPATTTPTQLAQVPPAADPAPAPVVPGSSTIAPEDPAPPAPDTGAGALPDAGDTPDVPAPAAPSSTSSSSVSSGSTGSSGSST